MCQALCWVPRACGLPWACRAVDKQTTPGGTALQSHELCDVVHTGVRGVQVTCLSKCQIRDGRCIQVGK